MKSHELNIIIDETITLGKCLLFNKFYDAEFSKYKTQVFQISENAKKDNVDIVQVKACDVIRKTKTEDFNLTFMGKVFYLFIATSMTGGLFLLKNTNEQICKRYIFDMNSMLLILKKDNIVKK
jgi:hypothetical protein